MAKTNKKATKVLDTKTQAIIDRLSSAHKIIKSAAPWRKDVLERIERSIELNTRIGACTSEEALIQIDCICDSCRLVVAGENLDREMKVDCAE